MPVLKPETSAFKATLIGDIVDSRHAVDRRELHDQLSSALDAVGRAVPTATALRITVGDEFQGSYSNLGFALDAAFRIRLALIPDVWARFGFGWGDTLILDARSGTQDGSAWWAAREAIEAAKAAQLHAATHAVRSVYRPAGHTRSAPGPSAGAVNAALLCQDQLLSSLDERSLRILRRLAGGESRTAIASTEGVSPSAISQRVVSGGLEVIVNAARELASVR